MTTWPFGLFPASPSLPVSSVSSGASYVSESFVSEAQMFFCKHVCHLVHQLAAGDSVTVEEMRYEYAAFHGFQFKLAE